MRKILFCKLTSNFINSEFPLFIVERNWLSKIYIKSEFRYLHQTWKKSEVKRSLMIKCFYKSRGTSNSARTSSRVYACKYAKAFSWPLGREKATYAESRDHKCTVFDHFMYFSKSFLSKNLKNFKSTYSQLFMWT